MDQQIIEGMWEEIRASDSQLRGRRVRITVLNTEEDKKPANITTGVELVKYWAQEGLLGTRTDIPDSVEFARALRKKAETRN